MYKIFVTNMKTGDLVEFKYKNKKTAINRFKGTCIELGYKYTDVMQLGVMVAGGVGYDFRIELVEIQ